MPFLDLFSDKADLYAAARPHYPEELFAFIASQSPARERAWDCGTGNGQAAVSLSRHFTDVFATDPSEEQLVRAVRASNIHYSVQPAETTDLPDRSMDAICVAQALHWFNFDLFFAEARRVAVPGALFAAWGYTWFSVSRDFDAAFRAFILDVIAPYWVPQNQILWDGYASVPIPFSRIEAPAFSITVRWNLQQLLTYVRTWSAARRCMAVMGSDFFETAERELAASWGDAEDECAVSMPLHFLAGRIS